MTRAIALLAFAFLISVPAMATQFVEREADRTPLRTMRTDLRGGEESIWGGKNLLAEKEFKKHDLITILIQENNKATTSLETDYERKFEVNLDVADAFQIKKNENGSPKLQQLTANSTRPNLNISTGRKHEGDGEIEHNETYEATITAEVIEVLPNGDLMLEARKRVTISEENSELILTGRVRPQDISASNTVQSNRVADSHIIYKPKGAVADANKRSWLHRLFDFVNIF